MTHYFLIEHFKVPRSQNQILISLVSIQVAMIANTWFETFSTIVTTVVSPKAEEVNYIEGVHIDCSVEIINLIVSRNKLSIKMSHLTIWNTDVNLFVKYDIDSSLFFMS